MKITVFTSNQPRHHAFVEKLSRIADEVYFVSETTTLFPGMVADYYKTSETMKEYFSYVRAAEDRIFKSIAFSPKNVRVLPLFLNDLSKLSLDVLAPALKSDFYVVFGASYIKGDLCKFLIEHKAVNVHLGTSPYYRGSSCNFWALYDNKPDYVGATIHLLSAGLDSGAMLFHALPAPAPIEPFDLGMRAVEAAQVAICDKLRTGELFSMTPVIQDRSREIRYTKGVHFTDELAEEYLARRLSPEQVEAALRARDLSAFLNPALF